MKTNPEYNTVEADKAIADELMSKVKEVCSENGFPVLMILGVPGSSVTHMLAGGLNDPAVRSNLAEAIMHLITTVKKEEEVDE